MQSHTGAGDSGSSTLDPNAEAAPAGGDAVDNGRQIRSIPPWVLMAEDDHDPDHTQPLLFPNSSVTAKHHYLPAPQGHKAPGRKWDHLRSAEPALLDQPLDMSSARWLPYMHAGPQPHDLTGARLVSDEWMEQNVAGMNGPWQAHEDESQGDKEKGLWVLDPTRRKTVVSRAERTVLKNPFIPLVFRLLVLTFTLCALGLGARVYQESRKVHTENGGCVQRASTYMAIAIDSIAVPYIGYVTWDEYMSKPLGLRSATAKTALLLTDLYFIVFYSSNLSLAFDALKDHRWACYQDTGEAETCPNKPTICNSQAGLAGVLVVALLAWLITFSISVLRVVERLGG